MYFCENRPWGLLCCPSTCLRLDRTEVNELMDFFFFISQTLLNLRRKCKVGEILKGGGGFNSKLPNFFFYLWPGLWWEWPDLFICDPVYDKSDPTFLFLTRFILRVTHFFNWDPRFFFQSDTTLFRYWFSRFSSKFRDMWKFP